MASSVSEDQDQRNNVGLEDLTTMTIESLRARLLSERAISKSSRQRADELAKRVLELEEQLKMVSLQRKRAEKATADVLAILESNGISDASDAYDSNSDQETISDSKVSDDTMKRKETSSNFEVRTSDMEAYSSSEIDSSASTGRSLSWKSSKDSLHSLQRTKYTEAVGGKNSAFPSNVSSFPKRVGKSCRRIQRRESRSVSEQLQDNANTHESQGNTVDTSKDSPTCADIEHPADQVVNDAQGNTVDTFSKDIPTCADIEHPANEVVNDAPGTSVMGMPGNRGVNAFHSDGNGQNEDIDGTLQHQTQFIGQFEANEKGQMEWEVRENSSSVLDSCDPGNRSDVTEERDDVRALGQLNPGGTIDTHNLGSKLEEVVKPSFSEGELKLKVANGMVIPSNIDSAYLQDQRTSSIVDPGLSSFTSKVNQSQVDSGNLDKTPPQSIHMSSVPPGKAGIPSMHGPSVPARDGESSGTKKELALIPQKSSNNLESVLKELQQARLSLNQKLHGTQLSEIRSSVTGLTVSGMRTGKQKEIPVEYPGIFRLPTDFPSEATAKVNYLGSNSPSIAFGYNEPSTERFLRSPYEERRSSALLGNQLYGSTPSTGIWPAVHRRIQTPTFRQDVVGLHANAMPFMATQSSTSASRAVYENGSDTVLSSSSRSSDFDPLIYPGLVPRLYASVMPFTEIQPSIPATRPVYESASSSGPSSGKSSYLDNQVHQGLVPPGRYTHPTYPFYSEVPQQVPANDRRASNVPSVEYRMSSASRDSLYDDHIRIRPNMHK